MAIDVTYVSELTQRIQRAQEQENKYSQDVKTEFAAIMNELQESGNVITKSIESRYKEIDRLFQFKQRQIEIQNITEKELKRSLGL